MMGCVITTVLTRPKNKEKPRTNKFLDEFRSTNCKFDRPTAAIIPNMTQKIPPTIGSGIVMKKAPNLERRPKMIMNMAPY